MIKLKYIMSMMLLITSITLSATEEMSQSKPTYNLEQCSSLYSNCMKNCDNNNSISDIDGCYDKCDEIYSKCSQCK